MPSQVDKINFHRCLVITGRSWNLPIWLPIWLLIHGWRWAKDFKKMWWLAIIKQLLSESFSVLLGCLLLIALARKRRLLLGILVCVVISISGGWHLQHQVWDGWSNKQKQKQNENWGNQPPSHILGFKFPIQSAFFFPPLKVYVCFTHSVDVFRIT